MKYFIRSLVLIVLVGVFMQLGFIYKSNLYFLGVQLIAVIAIVGWQIKSMSADGYREIAESILKTSWEFIDTVNKHIV